MDRRHRGGGGHRSQSVLIVGGAWLLGHYVRTRRLLVAELQQQIADQLYISLYTAKTHVSRVRAKLHARDRAQLVMLAYETGLVIPGN
jgi:hypothetical protein